MLQQIRHSVASSISKTTSSTCKGSVMFSTRLFIVSIIAMGLTLGTSTAKAERFRISNNTNSDLSLAWAIKKEVWQEAGGLSSGSTHYEVHGWKRLPAKGETTIEVKSSMLYLLVLDSATGKFRAIANEESGKKGEKTYRGFMVNRHQAFEGLEFNNSHRSAADIKKIQASNPPVASISKGRIRSGGATNYSNWDSKFWPGDPNLTYAWGFWKIWLQKGESERTFYIN
jgi:hypothetical protein